MAARRPSLAKRKFVDQRPAVHTLSDGLAHAHIAKEIGAIVEYTETIVGRCGLNGKIKVFPTARFPEEELCLAVFGHVLQPPELAIQFGAGQQQIAAAAGQGVHCLGAATDEEEIQVAEIGY